MSKHPQGGIKLKPQEIKKMLEEEYGWSLEDTILICMGIKPGTFNWNDCGGNDMPIRLKMDCLKALKKGELVEIEVNGRNLIHRDDLIPFCCKILDIDGEETLKIYLAYKAERAAQRAELKGTISDLELEVDEAVRIGILREYHSNKELYDTGRKKLKKVVIYRRINEERKKKHLDEWKPGTFRRSGAKFNIEWAKLFDKNTL